jgi:hypothetical protein
MKSAIKVLLLIPQRRADMATPIEDKQQQRRYSARRATHRLEKGAAIAAAPTQ